MNSLELHNIKDDKDVINNDLKIRGSLNEKFSDKVTLRRFDEEDFKRIGVDPSIIRALVIAPTGCLGAFRSLASDSLVQKMKGEVDHFFFTAHGAVCGSNKYSNDDLSIGFQIIGLCVDRKCMINFNVIKTLNAKLVPSQWYDAVPWYLLESIVADGQAKLFCNMIPILRQIASKPGKEYVICVAGSASPCLYTGVAYVAFAEICAYERYNVELFCYDPFEVRGCVVNKTVTINWIPSLYTGKVCDILVDDMWDPQIDNDKTYVLPPIFTCKKLGIKGCQPYYDGHLSEVRFESHPIPYSVGRSHCRCSECKYVADALHASKMSSEANNMVWSFLLASSGHSMMHYSADFFYRCKLLGYIHRKGSQEMNTVYSYLGKKPTVVASIVGGDGGVRHPWIAPGDRIRLFNSLDPVQNVVDLTQKGRGYNVDIPTNSSDYVLKYDINDGAAEVMCSMIALPYRVWTVQDCSSVGLLGRIYNRVGDYCVSGVCVEEVPQPIRVQQTSRVEVECAGALLKFTDGRYLSVMCNGVSDLPKGKRLRDESLIECAIREAMEEAHLRRQDIVAPQNIKGVRFIVKENGMTVRCTVFYLLLINYRKGIGTRLVDKFVTEVTPLMRSAIMSECS